MQQEKRRPTLDELRESPVELWRMEICQIAEDACTAGQLDIELVAMALLFDPSLTPERVVELREQLNRATGSTEIEDAA